jgi:POT family proton-dependent oligopeptide transporter
MLLAPAVNRLMHLDTLGDDNVGDDLVGQKEFGEAAAAGIHPPIRE